MIMYGFLFQYTYCSGAIRLLHLVRVIQTDLYVLF